MSIHGMLVSVLVSLEMEVYDTILEMDVVVLPMLITMVSVLVLVEV